MGSGQHRTGFGDFTERPRYYPVKDLRVQLPGGEAHEIQAGHRPASHGVHVAEGVGGGDLPEQIGIVDRRRDEIRRHHQGDVIAESVDAGVIAGLVADEEIRILLLRQLRQQLGEPDRAHFGRSAAGLCQPCQCLLANFRGHRDLRSRWLSDAEEEA